MLDTIREIWRKRAIVQHLVQRELTSSYRTKTLGFLWALLDPLMFMGVYYVVFGRILASRPLSFMIHLFVGVVAFRLLTKAGSQSASCLRAHSSLIREIKFPLSALPASVVIARLFDFAAAWLIAIPLSIVFHNPVTGHWVLVPLIMLVQILFVTGFCFVVAYVGVFFADIENLLGVFFRLWFYMTPVLYPLSLVEKKAVKYSLLLKLYMLNPMTSIVECYTSLTQGATLPQIANLLYALAIGLLFFFLGILVFSRKQGQLAKYV